MLKFLLALFVTVTCAWILFSGDSDEDAVASTPPDISVSMPAGTTQEVVDLAKAALDEFLKACPDAAQHWADVTTAEMSYSELPDSPLYYEVELYGWSAYLELLITIKNDPDTLPPLTSGHTLHYQLGGGERSGLITFKDQGMAFCGFGENPDPNANYFVSWPPFELIKG